MRAPSVGKWLSAQYIDDLDVGLHEFGQGFDIIGREIEDYILGGGGREKLGQQLPEQESEREHGDSSILVMVLRAAIGRGSSGWALTAFTCAQDAGRKEQATCRGGCGVGMFAPTANIFSGMRL